MTCVYKEYEIKTKMVQEQLLQLRMKFLFVYNMKTVIYLRGNKNLVGESTGENRQIFS